jgi:hypothetical protein
VAADGLEETVARARRFRESLGDVEAQYRRDGHDGGSPVIEYLRDLRVQVDAWLEDPEDPVLGAETARMVSRFNELVRGVR